MPMTLDYRAVLGQLIVFFENHIKANLFTIQLIPNPFNWSPNSCNAFWSGKITHKAMGCCIFSESYKQELSTFCLPEPYASSKLCELISSKSLLYPVLFVVAANLLPD